MTAAGWDQHSRTVIFVVLVAALLPILIFAAADATAGGKTDITFDSFIQYSETAMPFAFLYSDGAPIFQTMDTATDTVDICIYELTSPAVLGLLVNLEKHIGSGARGRTGAA